MQVALSPRRRGFTMVELVIAIAVLAIISVTAGAFLMPMFRAGEGLERRAALVDELYSGSERVLLP